MSVPVREVIAVALPDVLGVDAVLGSHGTCPTWVLAGLRGASLSLSLSLSLSSLSLAGLEL